MSRWVVKKLCIPVLHLQWVPKAMNMLKTGWDFVWLSFAGWVRSSVLPWQPWIISLRTWARSSECVWWLMDGSMPWYSWMNMELNLNMQILRHDLCDLGWLKIHGISRDVRLLWSKLRTTCSEFHAPHLRGQYRRTQTAKCYRLLHRYKTRVYTETPAVSDTREESQSSCLKRNSSTAIISPKPKPFQKRESLLTSAHHHILSRNQQSQQAVNGPAVTGMGRFAGSKTTPNKVFCDFGVAWAEWAHALPKKLSNTVIRDVVFPVFPH